MSCTFLLGMQLCVRDFKTIHLSLRLWPLPDPACLQPSVVSVLINPSRNGLRRLLPKPSFGVCTFQKGLKEEFFWASLCPVKTIFGSRLNLFPSCACFEHNN